MTDREKARSAAPISAGVPRRILKARKALADYAQRTIIRAQCVACDGYCRFAERLTGCSGRSEWMHLGDQKRARTRGMLPAFRHTMAGSMMGCHTHHGLYDAGVLRIALGPLGANGPIRVDDGREIVLLSARNFDRTIE